MSGLYFSGNHIPPASPYRTNPAHKLKIKTKLLLTDKRPVSLKGNYSLSFRVCFWSDFSHGNIFKVENAKYSLKLNFDHHPDSSNVFLILTMNGEPTSVIFPFRRDELHDGKWFDLIYTVDEAKGEVTGEINGEVKTYKTAPFLWEKESNIAFGGDWTTHDCAAMILRDLKLSMNGVLEHHWLFTEMEGNTAFDAIGDLDARVTDHEWLINRHFIPAEKDSFFIRSDEPARLAVDRSRKLLIIKLPGETRVHDLTLRRYRILSPAETGDPSWALNDTNRWDSPSFFFDDSLNQLRYSIFKYPANNGVLIRIYTLRLPVLSGDAHEDLLESSPTRVRERNNKIYTLAVVTASLLLIVSGVYATRKLLRKRRASATKSDQSSRSGDSKDEPGRKNYISIFGGLKLINEKGRNVADDLPPKLRELAAMILYHSAGESNNRSEGVDFKLLEDIFWYNIKSENIKNNRNVAFSNMRKVLEEFDGLTLDVGKNRVSLNRTENIGNRIEEFFTLVDYLNISQASEDETAYSLFAGIVSEGIALADLHSEWAESTRSKLRYKVIGILEKYMGILFKRGDHKTTVKIAEIAFMHDPLHETTLKMMVKSLVLLSETSQAEEKFVLFCRRYQEVYNEEFPFELEELLEE
ncbi:MAG: hypothetical protein HBSAPP04_00610 [Ignavibacteriaceae bacterium]|nr:MAG: hypothetical protein HBSAPP04_00610 [Ignavibacteriaceae bacterium]